jgi:hypothetical protein
MLVMCAGTWGKGDSGRVTTLGMCVHNEGVGREVTTHSMGNDGHVVTSAVCMRGKGDGGGVANW